jgi:hypothetical protein
MLLEFLPHLSRLIPAADNYFSSRKESDRAQAVALTALGEELRDGLAKATEEQAAFRSEFQQLIASSAQVGADAARARTGVENLESRVAAVEKRLTNISRLLWAALVVLALVLILTAVRAFR